MDVVEGGRKLFAVKITAFCGMLHSDTNRWSCNSLPWKIKRKYSPGEIFKFSYSHVSIITVLCAIKLNLWINKIVVFEVHYEFCFWSSLRACCFISNTVVPG